MAARGEPSQSPSPACRRPLRSSRAERQRALSANRAGWLFALFVTASYSASGQEAQVALPDVSGAPAWLMRICLAKGLPTDPASDAWITDVSQSERESARAEVYTAQGALVTDAGQLAISPEAVEHGCDLVVDTAPDSPGRRFYLFESAPDGPMPDTRSTLDFLAKHEVAVSALVFTNGIDDADLMSLMKQEIDDLALSKGIDLGAVPHFNCAATCRLLP